MLESERERGILGLIRPVREGEVADSASRIGRTGGTFQNACPNSLTRGRIEKSPDPMAEPGLLNALFGYFDRNKWRPLKIIEPLDALKMIVPIIAFLPLIGQGLFQSERWV